MRNIYTVKHPVVGRVRWRMEQAPAGSIEMLDGFVERNIVEVFVPQLKGVRHGLLNNPKDIYDGQIRFFKDAGGQLVHAFDEIQKQGLQGHIISFHGSFNARLIKRDYGGYLNIPSNHAFGTAFDINADFNPHGRPSAPIGTMGSVHELVPIFERYGFKWGGNFSIPDGMHFEIAELI